MFVINILQSNSISLDLTSLGWVRDCWLNFTLPLLYWITMKWLQLRLLLEVFLTNAKQQLVLERSAITVDYRYWLYDYCNQKLPLHNS